MVRESGLPGRSTFSLPRPPLSLELCDRDGQRRRRFFSVYRFIIAILKYVAK